MTSQLALRNLNKVKNFQLEINEQLRDIRQRVEDVRLKVRFNRQDRGNFSGFLVGDLADYIDSFDF